jgi:glycosyltransferase involved in cell wall biosynthesis
VHTEAPNAAEHRNAMVLNWHRNADALIAPSQHLANQASEHQLGPIAVIRHGLSDEWFAPRTAVAADAPFVHIGTIAKHKGTDLVVSAHRTLGAAPRLVLHGSILDPEAALGHPVGRTLDPGGVRAALQKARALVLGSRWPENAPLIIIEARAAGCPIIAPRIGGIPELIEDGVDGLLYSPNDEVDLRDAMKRLLDGPPLTPRPPPKFRDQLARIEAIYRRVQRQSA